MVTPLLTHWSYHSLTQWHLHGNTKNNTHQQPLFRRCSSFRLANPFKVIYKLHPWLNNPRCICGDVRTILWKAHFPRSPSPYEWSGCVLQQVMCHDVLVSWHFVCNWVCRHERHYGTLSITRGIFSLKNSKKAHHSSPVRARYGRLLRGHSLDKFLTFFFSYCVQCRVIFDREISRVYSTGATSLASSL